MAGLSDNQIDILVTMTNKASADMAAIKAQLDGLGGSASKMSGLFSTLGSIGTRAFSDIQAAGKYLSVGILAASTGLVAFGVESVKAFSEFQVATAKMDATLATMGEAGSKARDQIVSLAEANTKMGFNVGDSEAALARLFQITGDVDKATSAFTTTEDIARFMNIDLASAAKQTAMAIEGKGRLYNQMGINVKEAGGAEAAYAILQAKLAGQSEAYSKTWAGAVAALGATWDDVKDKIGAIIVEKILPQLTKLIDFLINHKDQIISFFTNMVSAISDFAQKVQQFIAPIIPIVQNLWNNLSDENKKAIILGILGAIGVAILAWAGATIIAFAEITVVMVALSLLITLISKAWNDNFLGIQDITKAVWSGIVNFYNQYLVPLWEKAKTDTADIVTWFKANWDNVSKIFSGSWQSMKGAFEVLWAILSGSIKVAIDVFTGNWGKAWDDIKTAFQGIWNGIKDIFSGIWKQIQGEFILGINYIIGKINSFINGVNGIKMPDWMPGIGGKSIHISNIPTLATGTNYVPQDTLAYIHQGEAVVPKQYNPYAGGQMGGGNANYNFNFSGAIISDKDGFVKMITKALDRRTELRKLGSTV